MGENFQKFIEAVKAGKVEGLAVHERRGENVILTLDGAPIANKCFETWHLHTSGKPYVPDHLCAHIRRWLSGQGLQWALTSIRLSILAHYYKDENLDSDWETFATGSELDWHIDAALWVLEREEA
jgi:hypothetical protein